jgi:lysine 6-dehydrogenase
MKKIIVLGAGMVGRAIALDLAADHEVHSADIDESALERLHSTGKVTVHRADLRDQATLQRLVAPFDLVVSAVPGFMGFRTIDTVIRCGKDLVDISFMPEDFLPLDQVAKAHGVTAITDCGVAPGLPNILAGYHHARAKIHRFEYMVGGLPRVRTQPFEYKAPFSPCDVIEEYTRPARMVENGNIITKPALSEPELYHFDQVGTLEGFNSDGLRSLLYTLPGIPEMKEKTLRYPGHIDKIRLLRDAGFFSTEKILIPNGTTTPLEITTEVLKKNWYLPPEEEEFTIMRILFDLEDSDGRRKLAYELYDEYDLPSATSSMARTTGYTCTAVVDMILKGVFASKGLFPPEKIGTEQLLLDGILTYLTRRGVELRSYFYSDSS